MITNSGFIEDYTNDGEKNRTFPNLKQTYYSDYFPGVKAFKSIPYDIFGVYHNNFLHFISCDTEKSVKIYHIDNHRMESIPDSKIPNVHLLNVKGLQVGKYFWIFGGIIPLTSKWQPILGMSESLQNQMKTDLWVMKRKIWIEGYFWLSSNRGIKV